MLVGAGARALQVKTKCFQEKLSTECFLVPRTGCHRAEVFALEEMGGIRISGKISEE